MFEEEDRLPQESDSVIVLLEASCISTIPVLVVQRASTLQPLPKNVKERFRLNLSILSGQNLCTEFPKSLKTREELTEYLTVVVFTASAQHAAVNFGQVSNR